jgi:MFS family permease
LRLKRRDSGLNGDKKPRVFYGYVIVLVGFCIQALSWGMLATFGTFFSSFVEEFGWLRATISGAASLAGVVLGFVGIIAGRLGDRIGPRMVMVGCGAFLGSAYLLMSRINAPWQLYLFYGVIAGIGFSGMDVLPLSTVARWFARRRGMMTAIVKIGSGVGMWVLPLVATQLIFSYGWRDAYVYMGIVVLVVIVVAAQFLRRDPSRKGLLPYGVKEVVGAGEIVADIPHRREDGFSLREAMHTSQFRILCAIYAITLFCGNTMLVHIAPHAVDLGFTQASAAGVLATIGAVSIAGRAVIGSAVDRIGTRRAVIICSIVLLAGLVWLQFASELWMLYLFAAMYGFSHGGFFTVLSPLLADLFGLSSHGAIFGGVFFSATTGGAVGPMLAGRIFDVTGSYQLAFLICGVASAAVLILSLFLRPLGEGGVIDGPKRGA